MYTRSDIEVFDNKGNLVLVVDTKNKLGTNSEWAAIMRQNMMVHGLLPSAPFFLLALPDRFYLWKSRQLSELEKPDYEIDTAAILKTYSERIGADLQSLSGASFELLLISWLRDLIRQTKLTDTILAHGTNDWLVESGLLEAIKEGIVVSEGVR